jgi:succinyl-diaminopimelate desuccinylase
MSNNLQVLKKNKFISDLKSLVGFQTVTGQTKGFKEAIAFIKSQIHTNATITNLENQEIPILIAANHNTKNPDICFLSHLDVVPGNSKQFSLKIVKNKVFGRGVTDMKYSIPIGYELLNKLIEEKSKIKFSFVVTCDEERGGFKGTKYLADTYKFRPKAVICPDGGDNFVSINKSKGVFQSKITSKGKPAHSSRPWLGKNALVPIVKLSSELFDKYQMTNSEKGWDTTLNIGIINGGETLNKVPDSAFMRLDFRYVPEKDSCEKLENMLKEMILRIDPNLKLEVTAFADGMFTEKTNQIFKLFTDTMQYHLKKVIKVEGAHGSNDARYFNKYGIPILMSRPKCGDIHGDNEWLDVPSSQLFAKIIYDFVQKYGEKYLNK